MDCIILNLCGRIQFDTLNLEFKISYWFFIGYGRYYLLHLFPLERGGRFFLPVSQWTTDLCDSGKGFGMFYKSICPSELKPATLTGAKGYCGVVCKLQELHQEIIIYILQNIAKCDVIANMKWKRSCLFNFLEECIVLSKMCHFRRLNLFIYQWICRRMLLFLEEKNSKTFKSHKRRSPGQLGHTV